MSYHRFKKTSFNPVPERRKKKCAGLLNGRSDFLTALKLPSCGLCYRVAQDTLILRFNESVHLE